MDKITTQTKKVKEDEINIEEFVQENKQNPEIMDASIFDETLNEIDQILNTLEQKSDADQNYLEKHNLLPKIKTAISKIQLAKNELIKEENNLIKNNNLIRRIEDLEKNTNNSNETSSPSNELKDQTLDETEEHIIDKNLLSADELHKFKENDERKKKNSFGFYSYLILIIVTFFTFYGALYISKDIIVLKFPITEPYIQYFFEIVEIIKVSILGVADFIKNKI